MIASAVSKIVPDVRDGDGSLGLRLFSISNVAFPEYTSQTKENMSWMKDFQEYNRNEIGHEETVKRIAENGQEVTETVRVSADISHPKFASLDKLKDEISKAAQKVLSQDQEFIELVGLRIVEYKKTVQKLTQVDLIKSIVKTGNDKVRSKSVEGIRDCASKNRSECELLICEGKSAEGAIQPVRDRQTQAILPLRGRPLNAAADGDIESILQNKEMVAIINGVGAGIEPVVDISAARYGSILIVTDADPDGMAIRASLIGAFAFLNPEIIRNGMLYVFDLGVI
jgi:DNA gyrase/topoisomerase IV subunit B